MPSRHQDTKEHQESSFSEKATVGTLHATSLQALVANRVKNETEINK